VMLIPGLLAGDWSMALMARWLRRIGYAPVRARLRRNADCAGATVARLSRHLRAAAGAERVAVVGQSRGGLLGRALAVREHQNVAGLVTLGSPMLDEMAIQPQARLTTRAVALLGDCGVPGAFGTGCRDGPCCERYYRERAAPFPADVGFVSIYSRHDGVVDWRQCLDPDAEQVEVAGSHVGMSAEPGAYRAIAGALDEFFAQRQAGSGRRRSS